MRAGIAACQPKKWLDLFAFHLAPLLPVQMHCGLTDPPNAVVESRSTPTIAVNHRKPSLWGWLSSSEPLDFWSLLGSCTALDGQLEQFLNLILAKDWSGSQANDWHLMPASNFCDVLMFHRNRPFDNQLGSCEIMSSLAATPCLCLRVLRVTVLRKGTDVDS